MVSLHQQINQVARKTYGQVNRMFPEQLPILEKDEAERAYKKRLKELKKRDPFIYH